MSRVIADGSVVQVQPSDLPTLNMAISAGNPEDWVLSNNTVRELSVPEMTESMLSGIEQGKLVWKTYTDKLKEL